MKYKKNQHDIQFQDIGKCITLEWTQNDFILFKNPVI